MDKNNYRIVDGVEFPAIREFNYTTARIVWPQFMLHDPVSELFSLLFTEEKLAPYQFAFIDNKTEKIILMGNSIPLYFDGDIADLPDRGWDWGLEKGIADYRAGIATNMQMAIQIMIPPEGRGLGLSALGVEAMKAIGRKNGLRHLIAPVRPNMKHLYPLTPFEKYIYWTNGDGLPFDGWMRVHSRLGAKIIKPAHRSMEIPGSIAEWEGWTGMTFPDSGEYVIPGALNPIVIDRESDRGLYIEPNVWMHHNMEE